ncbi:GTP cyclohydrolase II [Xylanimonas sp. McL0601]|uniref:GTP cyclohydrolase II n=1 Tax=Xylanimonas sp. McL0601 TaxID=3414739 RepID=UPI003CEFE49B
MTRATANTLERALAALAAGRPVLVADADDREAEVDVVLAARHADARWVAWTVRHTSGYLCAPMPAARADALALPPMVADNRDPRRTAYAVSVDAATGVTTGISAADRARTLRVLADPATTPDGLIRPGHVLPLRAVPGGVLERPGHTEAAVDLVRLAGAGDVGVIAELVHDDGDMLRLADARTLAAAEGLELLTIAELAAWREEHDPVRQRELAPRVEHVADARLPTEHGVFRLHAFRDALTGAEHVALVAPVEAGEVPWVRVHSECLTGDSFGSLRCDCGPQLQTALRAVARHGGAVVHLGGHEGRGIGLAAKVAAYALQDQGRDTVEANLDLGLPVDAREYGAAAAILQALGLARVRLLTNNPLKAEGLRAAGVDAVGREPLEVGAGPENQHYLTTKKRSMGHLLELHAPAVTTSPHGIARTKENA